MDMVSNRIIGGMGLMVVGVVIFAFSSSYALSVLSSNRLSFLCQDICLQQYYIGVGGQGVGGFFALIGFFLVLVGALRKEKP